MSKKKSTPAGMRDLPSSSEVGKVDSTSIAEEILNEQVPSVLSFRPSFSVRRFRSLVTNSRSEQPLVPAGSDFYGVSQTEQIHHASIAEQIRAGQGSAIDPEQEKNYYDFPDGKDDGSDGVGIFDLSEPAEAYEREADFKESLFRSISSQQAEKARQQAEKARSEAEKSSSEVNPSQSSNDASESFSSALEIQ